MLVKQQLGKTHTAVGAATAATFLATQQVGVPTFVVGSVNLRSW